MSLLELLETGSTDLVSKDDKDHVLCCKVPVGELAVAFCRQSIGIWDPTEPLTGHDCEACADVEQQIKQSKPWLCPFSGKPCSEH